MHSCTADVTHELFQKRNEIGIGYYSKKDYFLGETDYFASL